MSKKVSKRTTHKAQTEPAPTLETQDEQVIPVISEELVVGKRAVEKGVVRVTKRVKTRQEAPIEGGFEEHVDVRHVHRNIEIEAPMEARQEGDTLIIPVMQEVLVVQKKLILKEELHITRRREATEPPSPVTLREEQVTVERLDGPTDTP